MKGQRRATGGQPHLTFKTSGASVESRRNVIKEARSNLGGAALPVNFFSTALTTAVAVGSQRGPRLARQEPRTRAQDVPSRKPLSKRREENKCPRQYLEAKKYLQRLERGESLVRTDDEKVDMHRLDHRLKADV